MSSSVKAPDLKPVGSGAQLWLLRHGEVHPDWKGKAYGALDVPLSAAGLRQTEELAANFGALDPDCILGSPLERARLLAQALAAKSGAPLELCAGLREIDRGVWQGLAHSQLGERYPAELAAHYADPWNWRGHGGENDAQVCARAWPPIRAALERLRGKPGATLVVASHYNVIRVLAARALALAPERSFALRIDTGRGLCLLDQAEGFQLRASNVRAPRARGSLRA